MANKCLVCYEPCEVSYHKKCSYKLFRSETPPTVDFGVENIETLALSVVNQRLALTGVQRKISLSETVMKNGTHRLTIVGFESDYILKPPSLEFSEVPELEDLTMHLAEIYSLETARHGLVKMNDGKLAYITRRFDRVGKRKIYVEDFCQLSLKMTEEKYKGSAELIAKTVKKHSVNFGEDLIKLMELFLFCFFTGNSDMHLKNFSLMRDSKGLIRFSPFYDLLSTRLLLSVKDDPEEFALPLNGKKSGLKRIDFKQFSETLGISGIVFDKSIQKMEACIPVFHKKIDQSFLSSKKKEEFHDLIDLRLKRLLQ